MIVATVIVLIVGLAGGYINSAIADRSPFPHRVECFLNIVLGAAAALVYWFLDGPGAEWVIFSAPPSSPQQISLPGRDLITAFLVGVAGGKYITERADKLNYKAAAAEAVKKESKPHKSAEIANTRRGREAKNIVNSI